MPQLNPHPWFLVSLLAWVLIVLFIKMMSTYLSPNPPDTQNLKSPNQTWPWPWL